MAELKACQSASQSPSVCVPTETGRTDRQYATLTTLPHLPHTCFELIQIKATFIYFQFRAAPATKTIPSAIQLKVSPKHTQIWCRNIAKKLISIGLKIAKVSLQLLLLLLPPLRCISWFAAFRLDSNMTSTNNTDSLAFPHLPWSICGAIRALIAGRAQAPAPASTPALSL